MSGRGWILANHNLGVPDEHIRCTASELAERSGPPIEHCDHATDGLEVSSGSLGEIGVVADEQHFDR